VTHTRNLIRICSPPSFADPVDARRMSSSCTNPPDHGRYAVGVSPRAAGAPLPPMRLGPNLFGQGPANRPTLRQATALGPGGPCRQRCRHPGAHGEPHHFEPSSAVLASWATSTARFPEGSGPGLPVRDADAPGIPRTSNPQGPDSSFAVPATWMRAPHRPTHRIGTRPKQDSCPAEPRK
jgi:hypothetical protein